MKKMILMIALMMTVLVSAVYAESATDVTLEWSDFTTEYVKFTSYSTASKEVALEMIQEDAVAFIATEGIEESRILSLVFDKVREQGKDKGATNEELAQAIVAGEINVIIK